MRVKGRMSEVNVVSGGRDSRDRTDACMVIDIRQYPERLTKMAGGPTFRHSRHADRVGTVPIDE
jgi:hypothetical protein